MSVVPRRHKYRHWSSLLPARKHGARLRIHPQLQRPDSESLGKVKDAALDKAQDLFAQGKAKLDKVRHLDIYDAIACLAV